MVSQDHLVNSLVCAMHSYLVAMVDDLLLDPKSKYELYVHVSAIIAS